MSDAKELADGIASTLADAPVLHELDDGETARLKIGYMKSKHRGMEGVTVGFHYGTGASDVVGRVSDEVESRLDKRKFRVSTDQPKYKQVRNWTLGWVEVNRDGEIQNYELDSQYLKPTQQ